MKEFIKTLSTITISALIAAMAYAGGNFYSVSYAMVVFMIVMTALMCVVSANKEHGGETREILRKSSWIRYIISEAILFYTLYLFILNGDTTIVVFCLIFEFIELAIRIDIKYGDVKW